MSYTLEGDSTTVTGISPTDYAGAIVIPDGVTTIGTSAFYGCTGLKSVTIPNSVTTISYGAFDSCVGLTSVTIPDSVTTIGNSAFYGCTGLKSVTIPISVTTIGTSAFDSCVGLTSVTIPNSVTTISYGAFYGCAGLTSVTIPNHVTTIGDYAFYGCTGLTSVTIPNSVTTIGDFAFYICTGLTSVTIPDSVTTISYGAFQDCAGLTSVTIPNSVTTIGDYAFHGISDPSTASVPYTLRNAYSQAFDATITTVTVRAEITAPCFLTGTPVLTPNGYKPIETIMKGDLVTTADGRHVPVRHTYRKSIDYATQKVAPYAIPAGCLGPNLPCSDLVMSPEHCLHIGGDRWLPARRCITIVEGVEPVRQIHIGKPIVYYNLSLPTYATDNLVIFGGVEVESMGPRTLVWEKSMNACKRLPK